MSCRPGKKMIRQFVDLSGKRVLEIGCGDRKINMHPITMKGKVLIMSLRKKA